MEATTRGGAGYWRYGMGKLLYGTSVYRYTLISRTPPGLIMAPPDPWPGNAERGGAILRGEFMFFGVRLEGTKHVWHPVGMDTNWLAELHAFDWLRDLRAVGGDAARRCARELVADWLDRENTWDEVAWRPDVLARRLFAWLGQHDFFCASADDTYRRRYLAALVRQGKHLARVLPAGAQGLDLLVSIKGLVVAGLALPDRDAWIAQGLRHLERETARQILPDGGHVSRCPAVHTKALRHLVDVRAALLAAGQPAPSFLMSAIDRAAPFLRMMRHGDGGLALFNGGGEDLSWLVDMLLAQADARGRPPVSAPHSGFERLAANRTVVLVDTGKPPAPGFGTPPHAGTLSFEMSIGKERLVVNCGAREGPSQEWATVQRTTAAHSTLVIDDKNSAGILPHGDLRDGPTAVECRREEADGSVWLTTSHDGYVKPFGLVHQRRLFVSARGDDIRGEDKLIRQATPASPARGFTVRFHLHPTVHASLVQDASAVLIQLPRGNGWRLRASGAAVSLSESVYLGGGDDDPRRGEQIVLSGVLGPPDAEECVAAVKWALRRIPRPG